MIDPLASANASTDLILLIHAIGRNDEGDVLTYGLLGGVAEEPLGGGIPSLNGPIRGLANNGILRGLDNGGQEARSRQSLGVLLFQPSPLGDVPEDQHAPDHLALGIADGRGTVVNCELAGVFSDED